MVMQAGEVDGPYTTSTGIHIIRLIAREPAHLPELTEVESQVNQDFTKSKTIEWAHIAANAFADKVFAEQKPLAEGAIQEGFTSTTTDFFKNSDPIGDLGRKTEINTAVFDLENIGDISLAVETYQGFSQPGAKQEVDAYYIAQLDEIKDAYIPELDEVRADVEKDYKLKLAENVVIAKANEVLGEIKQKISQSTPLSATQTIALEEFSDVTDQNVTGEKIKYYKPFDITGNGSAPGGYRSLELAKTALQLEPGKLSNPIISYTKKLNDDGQLVNDTLQGVFIVQVLGKPTEEEPADQRQMSDSQIEKFLEQAAQRYAFSAWITEVSATAIIEYNDEVVKPELQDEDGEALDS
jgi:parvulin-like peptidyl-prolyl isomerase